MIQSLSRIVALTLLGAMLAGAGMICLLPMTSAHAPMAGCHPAHVPGPRQPADYRCCVSRHPAALPTSILPPVSPLELVRINVVETPVPAADSAVFAAPAAPSGAPPGVVTLRI